MRAGEACSSRRLTVDKGKPSTGAGAALPHGRSGAEAHVLRTDELLEDRALDCPAEGLGSASIFSHEARRTGRGDHSLIPHASAS